MTSVRAAHRRPATRARGLPTTGMGMAAAFRGRVPSFLAAAPAGVALPALSVPGGHGGQRDRTGAAQAGDTADTAGFDRGRRSSCPRISPRSSSPLFPEFLPATEQT